MSVLTVEKVDFPGLVSSTPRNYGPLTGASWAGASVIFPERESKKC